jgi:hypothetical protein
MHFRSISAKSDPISSVLKLASGFVSDGTSVLRASSRLTRPSQPQLEKFHTGIEQPSGRAPSTEQRRHFGISIIQCRDLCRRRDGQCKSFRRQPLCENELTHEQTADTGVPLDDLKTYDRHYAV